MRKVYYDEFENKAIIDEVEVYPYAKAPEKKKSYRLTLLSLYDDEFVYHISIHETFKEARKNMMKTSCGTWKKGEDKYILWVDNGNEDELEVESLEEAKQVLHFIKSNADPFYKGVYRIKDKYGKILYEVC